MPGEFEFDEEPAKPAPRPKIERLEKDEYEEQPRSRQRKPREEEDRDDRRHPSKKSMSPLLLAGFIAGGVLAIGGAITLVLVLQPKDPDTPKGGSTPAATSGNRPVVAPQPKIDPTNLSDEMEKRVRKATVRILVQMKDGKQASGTGFVEKNSRLVVTNAHVIGALKGDAGPEKINIVVNSGEGKDKEYHLSAEVLAIDQENDLALIAPKIIFVGERHIVPDGIVVPKSQSPKERQRLFIFGYPFGSEIGKEITIGETAISSLRKNDDGKIYKIQVQGGLNPGNSGGPLVDSKGNVVGVAVSIIKGTDVNFAIPGEIVQEFIAKHRK